MHPHLNNIQYGTFEFVFIYFLRWIQAWVYYGFAKLHRSLFRANEPNQIEMIETVKSADEKYAEKYYQKFLKTFETDDALANVNVHRIFYDMEEYKKVMAKENNELEQEWKRRILFETTPRGNIAISFDPYRMAFVYYSDQTMNYKVLNAAALQYSTMFRCRDLFMDEFLYPEGKTSPLVELHKKDKHKLEDANAKKETKNLPHNLKDAPFAKLKSKGILPPANGYNKTEKPVSSDAIRNKTNHAAHKPQIMNTFVHLGKMANCSLFQITKKTPIETVPEERKKMSYKEYMASLGQTHFQFQFDNKDYFGMVNEETKLKLCLSDTDIASNNVEDTSGSDEISTGSYVNVVAEIATTIT